MAYDAGFVHLPSSLAALTGAMLIQIGTNFANDYYDFVKGADTAERTGPPRATQSGLIAPETMRRAMFVAFLLVFIPGAYILYRGGWPFLVIGVLSIASGILYTGGPYPLGYLGLGDLFVLVFFGPVAVAGTFYLQGLVLTPEAAVAGFAPGFISVAILTVNNLRDIEGDRAAGKRTLAVRFGSGFAKFEYVLSLVLAAVVIPWWLCWYTGGHAFALSTVLVLVVAMPHVKAVLTTRDGPSLNEALAGTGKLLLLFAILFSAGWIY